MKCSANSGKRKGKKKENNREKATQKCFGFSQRKKKGVGRIPRMERQKALIDGYV